MKNKHSILFFALVALLPMRLMAQTVTLKFTARDTNNQYVQLDRVCITNLTRGWQETIYWPDTILNMQNGTGVENIIDDKVFVLSQNSPNPFDGVTEVLLTTTEFGSTLLTISDISGRLVESLKIKDLQSGRHLFQIKLTSTGNYVLTAQQNGHFSSIKMMNGSKGHTNSISYVEIDNGSTNLLKYTTTNPFFFGDIMEYVGYASFNGNETESDRISQSQGASQSFTLHFPLSQNTTLDGQPCPNVPNVTDFDGNIYNTVQIGNQCWIKENIRVTHYSNGQTIPYGGTNYSGTDPYYYDVISSGLSLTERGYLYNWPAVMHGASSSVSNPSGVQGICPAGWHVPSDAEWSNLFQYVASQSQYLCSNNMSNVAKALASTTGWNSSAYICGPGNNQNENNISGFSAIPAGGLGNISGGDAACFWTSTQGYSPEDDPFSHLGTSYSWHFNKDNPTIYHDIGWGQTNGFSVRCLRD